MPNGGDCAITAFDDTAKTFTMEITGADLTFTHYPTKRGSGGTTPMVKKAYPDDPSNQYWVANKFFLLWAPKTDIPLRSEPVTVDFTNTIGYNQLRGLSITGVPNYDPDPYEDAATYQVTRVARVTFNKMNSNMRYTNPNGWNYAYTDPNASGDAIVNQVVPNQYFNAYIRVTNTGSETIENGVVCEKIDNTRTTFVDMTATAFRATQGLKDPDTGTIDFFISGNYSFMQGYNVQIGVPANGLTWSSMNNVTNEYMAPLTSGSAMSNASCGDADAIWFDSVAALRGAGYALQDVNRVRITFTSMTPGVNLLFFVPLKALPYMAAGSTDVPGSAYFEGDTPIGTYSPNQAYISGSNLSLTKSSDAIKIIGDEWAMLTKTSPSHPENISVGIDTQITYALQVNLTTNADPHDTTIFVWDVLPPYTTYVGGSTQFGGVNIEPVCGTALDPLPADVFPNGVPTGYTPCRWTIPGLAATRAPAGSTSGNAPLLTFRALVTAGAANGSPLYNTAFVDSLTNEVNLPVYMGGSQGFRCAAGEFCSRDDHVVVFDSAMKYTYQKFAKSTLVKPGEDLPYSLVYGVNDTGVTDLRILDVFPYTADTDPNRKSVFSGTLGLSSWLQPPAANTAAVPPLTEDPSIVYYYTNALPGTINRNPYDPSNSLNSGGTTVWCTQAQILAAAPGCATMTPANITAMMAVRTSNVPLVPGTLYQIDLALKPTGNVNGNYYTNNYSFAISGTPAYSTSNAARVSVAGVSPTMTKIVDRTTASSNEELVFTLLPRNNYVNSGAAPLPEGTTIEITDLIPAPLVLDSVSAEPPWICVSGPDFINCKYTVPAGTSIPSGAAIGSPIVIHTRVASGAGAQSGLFNKACLSVDAGNINYSLCAQANFRIIAVPMLELDKFVTSQGPYKAGDTLTYQLTAKNTGTPPLTDVTIQDPLLPNLSCTPAQPAILQPGSSMICTDSHVILQEEFDTGLLINAAMADSLETDPVNDRAAVAFNLLPVLRLEKTAQGPGPFRVGQLVNYNLVITNTGNMTLTNINLADPLLTNLVCDPALPVARLAPSATVTCKGQHLLTQAEFDLPSLTNTAMATSDQSLPDYSSAVINFTHEPALSVKKSIVTPAPYLPNQWLEYKIVATNSGNITLTNVNVTDPLLSVMVCDPQVPVASLSPGQTVTCGGRHLITQAEFDAGLFINTTTASSDQSIAATDSVAISFEQDKALVVVKTVVTLPPYRNGEEVVFQVLAINAGNSTLTNVSVSDALVNGLNCDRSLPAASLAPQEQITCTGVHTVTLPEVQSGRFTNEATAFSDQTPPSKDDETITFGSDPGLKIVKSVVTRWPYHPGQKIDYHITVTNTGDVQLTDILVTDPLLDDLTCIPANPAPSLNVKEMLNCFGSHTLTQEEYDSGSFKNTATAASKETDPVSDWAILPFNPIPALDLRKEVSTDQINWTKNLEGIRAGASLYYRITVRNTSTAAILDLSMADGMADCALKRGSDLLGDNDTIFEIGEIWAYYCSVTARPGTHTNTATVSTSDLEDISTSAVYTAGNYPVTLPGTGFAPSQDTRLLPQPAARAFTDTQVTLEIPRLDLTLPVMAVPFVERKWDVSWLGEGAGWLEGSAFPGMAGNSVITSHNYIADGTPGPFLSLNSLTYGDQVILHAFGRTYVYEVRSNAVVSAKYGGVFDSPRGSWISLLTCRDYDQKTGAYLNRVLVKAVLVDVQ